MVPNGSENGTKQTFALDMSLTVTPHILSQ